jgi:NAD(P)-dependent dehydrogenase (short-subunit alcohol dehydrogenase family)
MTGDLERTGDMKEFTDKVAVVTGAASGIGRATAIALANEGADLVLADVNDGRMEEVRKEIAGLGRRAVAVHTDVSKLDDVQGLFERSIAELGRVDILMNNAGVHMMGPVEKISIADWEWIIGINLWGVIHGIKVFLPHMLERGSGHIVNTASVAGLLGADPSIPYTVTKFAVVGLSESLAVYLRRKGIGVTIICPGLVSTKIAERERLVPYGDRLDGARQALFEALKQGNWSEVVPEGVISPETVADAAVRAVKENTFLVLTHPGHKEMILQQAQDPEGLIEQFAILSEAREGRLEEMAAGLSDARGGSGPSTAGGS